MQFWCAGTRAGAAETWETRGKSATGNWWVPDAKDLAARSQELELEERDLVRLVVKK